MRLFGTLQLNAALAVVAFALGGACFGARTIHAQSPQLTIADKQGSRTYSKRDLLSNPRLQDISVGHDPVYRGPKTYRALPMAELLKGVTAGHDEYFQVRATDNYSASIPAPLLKPAVKPDTEAFLAIENPSGAWPAIPGKTGNAGPFYIVWQSTGAPVPRTYWVYRVAAFAVTDSPYKRFPNLGIRDALPASSPVWRGRDRFVALCMACHRFKGDGEGEAGPDLGMPMNPVEYLQLPAHKALIRNPSSVRTWPGQKMPGFDESQLSEADLDAIIAWLTYKKQSG